MTDRQLLEAYLGGDVGAFERLVGRHEGALLRFAGGLLGDPEAAQDVVQETFLRLVQRARGLRRVEDLSSWLYRVCRNLGIDHIKREARMRRRERRAATCEAGGCGSDGVESREVRAIVARELGELPPNQREVLILRIQEGRSYREIGEVTGLSTGNVGYLVHHGLKNLARRLKAAGVL